MSIKDLVDALLNKSKEIFPRKIDKFKKSQLGDRLEVAKVLLRRFLKNKDCRRMVNYQGNDLINDKAVENYLNQELLNFYDKDNDCYCLEDLIDVYRHYTPPADLPKYVCEKCNYRKPFCLC